MRSVILYIIISNLLVLPGCGEKKDSGQYADAYIVETIPTPEGVKAEIGALTFLEDGRLVVCFLRGEVMIYDPKTEKWSLFAEGLHEPLGIMAISPSEFLIMQRPELTRVKDTDGDGLADLFETVTDDFGITGNYHEFNYGPVKDKEGNIFIALNSGSSGGDVQPEVRGRLDTTGRDNQGKEMFSVVPYRGWVMKLTPDGRLLPYASGFRSPNGIGFDDDGNLWVTENQGDWVGTSKLFHIQEGNFYGQPGGLIWRKGWNRGNPFYLPIAALDSMRTKASVLFPQNIIANSPTQPLCDATNGKFGPFAGQLFVGEMNSGRLVRVMLEKVNGVLQGACIPFVDNKGLRKGNNRLAFAPDGSLWVGQAAYGWGGGNGIQRIVFTGRPPADIYSMNVTDKGFNLSFTQPMDKVITRSTDSFQLKRYYYEYHKKYGSDRMDEQSIPITGLALSADGKNLSIAVDSLMPGYVYQLDIGDIRTSAGDSLANHVICYTLNTLYAGEND